jgi:hypothetical protein
LGPLSSSAIAKVLKNNLHIKKLDLYGNGKIKINLFDCLFSALRDPGTIAIVDLLRSPSCSITELNLGCNEIWEEGGKALGDVLKVNKSVLFFFQKKNLFNLFFFLFVVENIRTWCRNHILA